MLHIFVPIKYNYKDYFLFWAFFAKKAAIFSLEIKAMWGREYENGLEEKHRAERQTEVTQ